MTLLDRTVRAAALLTTPLLPDDYLGYVNPLWSTREPRGRVDAVLPETADSATLWIRPGLGLSNDFVPGQYVRVGVEIDGVRHWRTYSLTSVPGRADGRFSITVKATSDGFVSRHLVHATRPGTIVRLAPPAGEFVLDTTTRNRRLLFVTAGSGITPVMAMLRAGGLADAFHVHIAPSAADTIFGAELRRRHAQSRGAYVLHEHHDDTAGFFDCAQLDTLVPDWRERAVHVCGPAGLLDALQQRCDDAGVDLHTESFRPVLAQVSAEGGTVTFTASGKTVEADGATPILTAGEDAGALLPSGCRMGICHTCVGRLCSGAVRDLRTGELHDTEGELVRTCVSAAAGPVSIDL